MVDGEDKGAVKNGVGKLRISQPLCFAENCIRNICLWGCTPAAGGMFGKGAYQTGHFVEN